MAQSTVERDSVLQHTPTKNLLCLNVCGLKRRLQNQEFKDYISNFDIVCTMEAKTKPIDEQSVTHKGYKLFFHHRTLTEKKKRSGGIVIFFKNNIHEHVTEIKFSNEDYIQWFKLGEQVLGLG